MVISELCEAKMCDVPVEGQDVMDAHNNLWANAVRESISNNILEEVPDIMADYIQKKEDRGMTILEDFNFNSVYFYD